MPDATKMSVPPGLLEVAKYPYITFTSASLQNTEDGWLVTGSVTAHGHTVPVDLRIDRVIGEGMGLRVHGRAEHLDRTDFGITGSKGMVGRYLELDAFMIPSSTRLGASIWVMTLLSALCLIRRTDHVSSVIC